jgi:hypothetical protein
VLAETLPFLQFQTYTFDESSVKSRISHAVRHALEVSIRLCLAFSALRYIFRCFVRVICIAEGFFPLLRKLLTSYKWSCYKKFVHAIDGLAITRKMFVSGKY